MSVNIMAATEAHLDFMRAHLSAANRREALALGFMPDEALLRTWQHSERTYAVELDGELVALCGLCPTSDPQRGCPWMVGTERMPEARLGIVRHARATVREFLERYPRLENYVEADNGRLIRMLEWTGFTVDPPEPLGIAGEPFRRYHMESAI